MKAIADYKPGERFHTSGDWQTEPGIWEVVSHDPEFGMTVCKPITNKWEGQSEFFSSVKTVTPVEQNTA